MTEAWRALVAAACLLAVAGCFPADAHPGDGTGHRAITDPPGVMLRGVCPEYRQNNPGGIYYWDTLAFGTKLEAEFAYCSEVAVDSLGGWVVEERFDADGSYSIAAYLTAARHSVTFDWGGFEPTLWLTCWHAVEDVQDGPGSGDSEGGWLEATLWYFGPPQLFYGEPTPVEYQFEGEAAGHQLIWWGHPGQAEVAVLLPPDSFRLAADMRRATVTRPAEDLGPILAIETYQGESLSRLGTSQGRIEFDLVGLERAAFPVFDACEA